MGICQDNQDLDLKPRCFNRPAIKAQETCSPVDSKASYSALSKLLLINLDLLTVQPIIFFENVAQHVCLFVKHFCVLLENEEACLQMDSFQFVIETFHNGHYIHRDIKPDNFLIGTGRNQTTTYLIDFGQICKSRQLIR